jgi:DHA2 family methylenomycin A resistance protein-like MFS transporter
MLPPFVIIPFGMGLAVPGMTAAILGAVPPGRAGAASAVLNTARQSGGAVGVAVFGALASGGAAQIPAGLRHAALISVGLLGVAAILGSLMRVPVPVVDDLVKDRPAR